MRTQLNENVLPEYLCEWTCSLFSPLPCTEEVNSLTSDISAKYPITYTSSLWCNVWDICMTNVSFSMAIDGFWSIISQTYNLL